MSGRDAIQYILDRTPISLLPFPRSYWIIPGMLLAGEYPGAKRHVEAKDKIGRLVDCGIRQIINLIEPHETDHSGKPFKEYEEIVSQIAARKNAPVDCFRFPVADLSVPTVSQMKQILAAINTGVIRELATDLFDNFYAKKI